MDDNDDELQKQKKHPNKTKRETKCKARKCNRHLSFSIKNF